MRLHVPGLLVLLLLKGRLPATAQPQDPSAVLRVDVNLVQIDAIVKDKAGKQVSTLTKDDFVILEDGKPRTITNFAYVRTSGSAGPASPPGAAAAGLGAGPTGPGQRSIRRADVQRTIAMVVDDLKMSFESTHQAREALKKFVEQQMQPGDLVAILPTSSGVSALQQFTTDKRLLHAAIARIRFQMSAGKDGWDDDLRGAAKPEGLVASSVSRKFTVGSLGAMRYIIDGMRSLPGRKSLMLFSDGYSLYQTPNQPVPPVTMSDARRVSEAANQGGVVIYGVDARGLIYPGLQAKDDTQYMEMEEVRDALTGRSAKIGHNLDAFWFLSGQTGGSTHYNDNDLSLGVARMLEDQAGYYLIGFTTAAVGARPGKITLQWNRPHPGLRLRYRRGGALGPVEPAAAPRRPQDRPAATPAARLLAALNSPFSGNNGIDIRLTPAFVQTASGKPALRALLHIKPPDLRFSEPDSSGFRTARLFVLALTDDTANSTERSFTIRVKDEPAEMAKARTGGFVYALEHEVARPGAYQLRVAAMDGASFDTGSARAYVEVPDLRKGQVAASGLSMASGDVRARAADGNSQEDLSAAVRVFDRGVPFSYGWSIYNAKPGLLMQHRLVRDGKVVWTGKAFPVDLAKSGSRTPAGAVLQLGPKTDTGSYVLEVQLLDGKRLAATQWIDFDLR